MDPFEISVNDSNIWWPNGYGEQKLYDVDVSVSVLNVSWMFIDCFHLWTFIKFLGLAYFRLYVIMDKLLLGS